MASSDNGFRASVAPVAADEWNEAASECAALVKPAIKVCLKVRAAWFTTAAHSDAASFHSSAATTVGQLASCDANLSVSDTGHITIESWK